MIVTSIICPTSRADSGPPSKLTMRLHSVRPISSAGFFGGWGLRPGWSAPCLQQPIDLPRILVHAENIVPEVSKARPGHQTDVARPDHRYTHVLSPSACEPGARVSALVSARCRATATFASRKPRATAAIVTLAGIAQCMERALADHLRHGVGELDFTAGAGFVPVQMVEDFRQQEHTGRSAQDWTALPRAWASPPCR